jgi:hypothetical protein
MEMRRGWCGENYTLSMGLIRSRVRQRQNEGGVKHGERK